MIHLLIKSDWNTALQKNLLPVQHLHLYKTGSQLIPTSNACILFFLLCWLSLLAQWTIVCSLNSEPHSPDFSNFWFCHPLDRTLCHFILHHQIPECILCGQELRCESKKIFINIHLHSFNRKRTWTDLCVLSHNISQMLATVFISLVISLRTKIPHTTVPCNGKLMNLH